MEEKDLEGVPEIIVLKGGVSGIPLKYNDQVVGNCDLMPNGSIHARFNEPGIPEQLYGLLSAGLLNEGLSIEPNLTPAWPAPLEKKLETKQRYWPLPNATHRRIPEKILGSQYLSGLKEKKQMADENIPPRRADNAQLRISRAIELVYQYVKDRLEKTDTHVKFGIEDVYPVWFCFTLGNWKAMISTSLPDGMYYEVTYDKNNKRTYIDAYKKFENVTISDTPNEIGIRPQPYVNFDED